MTLVRPAFFALALVIGGFGIFSQPVQALGDCAPQWDGEVQKENNLWYKCQNMGGYYAWGNVSCWPYCETDPPCLNAPAP